ncbi:MAG: hypothetical protein QOF77_279 [Solirubrobacteraceae bacterium]|jgi:lipoprotein-anchoring transpeptidase ErfK/SrfK|nr:hypothetical protein [Solirubrobacteraceae bacterium]
MNQAKRLALGLTAATVIGTTGAAMVPIPATATATATPAAPVPALRASAAGGGQQVAVLTRTTQALAGPASGSAVVETVAGNRPITGEQTTLPVTARVSDAHGGRWLRVLLPGRPNGHSGWIGAGSSTAAGADWQIVISTSRRQVRVLWHGRVARIFRAVVGKPSTPTPLGSFFVEESVKLDGGDPGAPYALALSARSNVLQEFDGGPGQIAIHGIDNVGGVPGTAVSHGCIRVSTRAVTWLADEVGPGSRVTITA